MLDDAPALWSYSTTPHSHFGIKLKSEPQLTLTILNSNLDPNLDLDLGADD